MEFFWMLVLFQGNLSEETMSFIFSGKFTLKRNLDLTHHFLMNLLNSPKGSTFVNAVFVLLTQIGLFLDQAGRMAEWFVLCIDSTAHGGLWNYYLESPYAYAIGLEASCCPFILLKTILSFMFLLLWCICQNRNLFDVEFLDMSNYHEKIWLLLTKWLQEYTAEERGRLLKLRILLECSLYAGGSVQSDIMEISKWLPPTPTYPP